MLLSSQINGHFRAMTYYFPSVLAKTWRQKRVTWTSKMPSSTCLYLGKSGYSRASYVDLRKYRTEVLQGENTPRDRKETANRTEFTLKHQKGQKAKICAFPETVGYNIQEIQGNLVKHFLKKITQGGKGE